MQAARTFYPSGTAHGAPGTTLAFGFLLLAGFFMGRLFSRFRLPRLTGYLCCGIIFGPSLFDLLTTTMLNTLAPVKGIAVCLIALTAGGELNYQQMKPFFRTIRSITLWGVVGTAILCTLALFLMRSWLPFLSGLGLKECLVVCAVMGVAISALSPAVAIAIFNELGSDGPVTRTILGIVIVADLVVILLFATMSSLAHLTFGNATSVTATALHVAWELIGSIVVGVVFGVVLGVYLRKIQGGRALFVLLLCVLISEVGRRVGLDPLIVALSMGVFIENVTEIEASKLIHEIESASLPVYVVFFALAGASLDLKALSAVAIPAIVIVVVRAFGIWIGSRVGAWVSYADPVIARWTFVGMLPQAGLALALALLIPQVFPAFGSAASALIIGIVGINELFMPVILRWGLIRVGESKGVTNPDASH